MRKDEKAKVRLRDARVRQQLEMLAKRGAFYVMKIGDFEMAFFPSE
jgi:hypothetical protein